MLILWHTFQRDTARTIQTKCSPTEIEKYQIATLFCCNPHYSDTLFSGVGWNRVRVYFKLIVVTDLYGIQNDQTHLPLVFVVCF